tara:strand:- start:2985 stop:3455 length:471 start_codon:yes stop_codon:yes gene_type:complete
MIYFYGHSGNKAYKEFSNFYPSKFTYFDLPFKTGEHALHWRKAMLFEDYKTAKAILEAKTPSQAKKLGRQVRKFKEDAWANERFDYMVDILEAKFSNPLIKKVLMDTGATSIFEAAPKDRVWGIGLSVTDAESGKAHRGANLLGRALVEARGRMSV